MRNAPTSPALVAVAVRTLEYRDSARGADALRQIADAATHDPWGRAVHLHLSTDPDDAPEDCRALTTTATRRPQCHE